MRAALAGLADLLVRRTVPATPRLCDGCGRTFTRLTPEQCAQVGSDLLATCRRRGCDGRLEPVWSPVATDTFVRVLSAEETRLSKTAARGATRTAEPNDCEESKDMHTLQSETTPRGRQIAAALALAHLLESGPDHVTEWRIDDLGRLHGHVRRPHSDADARAAIHEFAGFLGNKGAERSQGRNDHAEWIHLSTSGTYRGVAVNVWTHVAIRATAPFGGAL